jgi:seryl-tRNA(Sec) selenium transferase
MAVKLRSFFTLYTGMDVSFLACDNLFECVRGAGVMAGKNVLIAY